MPFKCLSLKTLISLLIHAWTPVLLQKGDTQVYDVWRYQHANERDYTFFSSRLHTFSRIDLFVSPILSMTLHGRTTPQFRWWQKSRKSPTGLLHGAVMLQFYRIMSPLRLSFSISGRFSPLMNTLFQTLYILWSTHKAFLWDICIQHSRTKKKDNLTLTNLLSEIYNLEISNKSAPSYTTSASLAKLHGEQQSHLTEQYNKHLRRLKLNSNEGSNKAGNI